MVEAVVEFDYIAQETDELTLRKGDKIVEVKTQPGGWWEGVLAGKRGMFPDNFVKIISKQENSKIPNHNDVTLRAKGGRRCKVLFSYQPANEDELELTVNDIIDVLEEVEDGWWRGSLRDNVGVFPSNFVTEILSEERRPRPGSRDETPRLNDSESDNDRSTSVSSADSGNVVDGTGKTAVVSPDMPSLPPKPVRELCRAVYAYEAANSDELTLREGDLVTLVSREVQDRGWWKGELRGQVGLFPDNFVELVTEDAPRKPDRSSGTKLPMVTTNRARDSITKPAAKSESPPVPGKKPSLKKADRPGVTTPDQPDGAGPSRVSLNPVETQPDRNPDQSEFDSVARAAMLTHPTAGRAKAPGRRPPSSVLSKEADAPVLTNGTAPPEEPTTKKPWDAVKAPWMEELKLNQARKVEKPAGVKVAPRPQSMYSGDGANLRLAASSPPKSNRLAPIGNAGADTKVKEKPEEKVPIKPTVTVKQEKILNASNGSVKLDVSIEECSIVELRAHILRLESSLLSQKEMFERSLKELTGKLHEETAKRVQIEQQLSKLTDLVTGV